MQALYFYISDRDSLGTLSTIRSTNCGRIALAGLSDEIIGRQLDSRPGSSLGGGECALRHPGDRLV